MRIVIFKNEKTFSVMTEDDTISILRDLVFCLILVLPIILEILFSILVHSSFIIDIFCILVFIVSLKIMLFRIIKYKYISKKQLKEEFNNFIEKIK